MSFLHQLIACGLSFKVLVETGSHKVIYWSITNTSNKSDVLNNTTCHEKAVLTEKQKPL